MKYKRMRTRVSKYISASEKTRRKGRRKRLKSLGLRLIAFAVVGLYFLKNTGVSFPTERIVRSKAIETVSDVLSDIRAGAGVLGAKIADFSNIYLRENKRIQVNACADTKIKIPPELIERLSAASDAYIERGFMPAFPCSGEISSPYGERVHPIDGGNSYHNGIDIAATEGEAVIACFDGEIIKAEYSELNGNYIKIRHEGGYLSSYSHLKSLNVSMGDKVKKGDIIAEVGSTGAATGPHLHFEILHDGTPLNPMDYISGDNN